MIVKRIISISLLAIAVVLSACNPSVHMGKKPNEYTMQKELEVVPIVKVSEPTIEEKVDAYVAAMTLEEKIGQLFMVAFRQDEEGNPITDINEEIEEGLKKYPVGGVILFKENIQDKGQVTGFIENLQSLSHRPLWIGVDEEGGVVSRVGSNSQIVEIPFRAAGDIGKTGDVEVAYKEATRMGEILRELGFNMDFAPVADIYNNPSNTVIGERSFGKNSEEVSKMVTAFAKGLQDSGVLPVIKHFPGHGNTNQDSHEELAYIEKSLEEIEKEELNPFERALSQGVEAMMIGHLVVNDVDPTEPASLSRKWGNYIEEHFDTDQVLLITDALNMGAITNQFPSGEVAVKSFLAGYDILLMPDNIEEAFEGLTQAYHRGEITDERLDKSVQKIIFKKMMHNLLVIE